MEGRSLGELRAIVRADHAQLGYLERVWDHLTDVQKVELVTFAEAMAERNGATPEDFAA